jgi:uncharacterized membrane protein
VNSELFVAIFPAAGEAEIAWQFTEILRERPIYGLSYIALVIRGADGDTRFRYVGSPRESADPTRQRMLQGLAEHLLDNPVEAASSRLTGAGIDGIFVENVATQMGPNRSALMIYLPDDSLADIDQLMEFLNLMEATIHRTTLPDAVIEALLRQEWNYI